MFSVVGIIVLLAVARMDAQDNCAGRPDGPCCAGCNSYTQCTGGVGQTIDCTPDVYNELLRACDTKEDTPPPCGSNNNCTALPDGKYADMTAGKECQAFFTCLSGENKGVSPCNPPNSTALVFNSDKQVCD